MKQRNILHGDASESGVATRLRVKTKMPGWSLAIPGNALLPKDWFEGLSCTLLNRH